MDLSGGLGQLAQTHLARSEGLLWDFAGALTVGLLAVTNKTSPPLSLFLLLRTHLSQNILYTTFIKLKIRILYKKYPNLPKLPNELDQSLEKLKNNKDINDAFGKEVINSYIKLKNSEINQFKQKENFDKTKAITRWERDNTLDC